MNNHKKNLLFILPFYFFLNGLVENLNFQVVMQEKFPADPKKELKKI